MDTNNIQQLSEFVVFYPVTAGIVIAAILAAFLLFLSGFASGSEVAFFSLSPQDIDKLNPQKSSADASIEKLRLDSERTLATILIMNNFINVTIIMLCNYIFKSLVRFQAVWLEFLCITVLLTFLLLLFGEIMPKVYT
ncbi:CNNM domain-containing protein, partial [Hallella bergensis]